jgi:predicted transcriptional regulator
MFTEDVRRKLKVLSKKYSLEILCALFKGGKKYVSQLGEELGIPYTTIQQRVNELESVGLIKSSETLHLVSRRPIKEVELSSFQIVISPRTIPQILAGEQGDEGFRIGMGLKKEEVRKPSRRRGV